MQILKFTLYKQACTLVHILLVCIGSRMQPRPKRPNFLSFKFIVNANFRILIFAFPEYQSQLENLGKIFDFLNWGLHHHHQKNSLQYSRSSWNLIWLSGNNWRFRDIVNYCLSVSDWTLPTLCQNHVKIVLTINMVKLTVWLYDIEKFIETWLELELSMLSTWHLFCQCLISFR